MGGGIHRKSIVQLSERFCLLVFRPSGGREIWAWQCKCLYWINDILWLMALFVFCPFSHSFLSLSLSLSLFLHHWQMLTGNHDTYSPHKNILSHPLVGINLIRIVPYAIYQRTTCLRFELYGCRHDHTLPISYAIPDGFKGSSFGDLRDLTYDGRHDFYGYLTNGLGQLTDGIKGDDNYKVNYGFEWVGWRTDGSDLSMIFQFDSIVNFTSATFYCHNLFSKDVQVSAFWFQMFSMSVKTVCFTNLGFRWCQSVV